MKKAILIGVPHHCNLGDHAIAIAERELIKRYYPEYEYKEVAEENVHKCIEKIAKNIEKEDILFFHGGGNLGNQYLFIETARRKVIEMFPENQIIVFPETIFFQDTPDGQKELEITKNIYNKHKKLVILAREEKSYQTMKEIFTNNEVILTPDIVTILQESVETTNRKGALFIIRNDSESNVEKSFLLTIEDICKSEYKTIEYTDTAKGGQIFGHQSKLKLDEMLNKYRESELIVTDRLHGMIFAAITGTPCIAVGNYNHKIRESAKWFKDLQYIKYIEADKSIEDIQKYIEKFKENKNYQYSNEFSLQIFDKVFEEIRSK